ncbi:MAG: hypothetical protein ABSD90_13320, partial [Methylocystis sp.]
DQPARRGPQARESADESWSKVESQNFRLASHFSDYPGIWVSKVESQNFRLASHFSDYPGIWVYFAAVTSFRPQMPGCEQASGSTSDDGHPKFF